MNLKSVFRMVMLLVLAFSLLGVSQPVFAQPAADVEVVVRDLTYWNGTFSGSVNEARYEKWSFSFTEQHTFTVTATTTWGDLVPLVTLLDAGETPLVSQVGSFTSTQPAGDYFILVQPQSGSGNYSLTIREAGTPGGTSVSVDVNPSSVTVGESALVTVSLNNVPGGGLTSAEFTCTYDASLIEVSAITDAGLFGSDAAVAINGPASGAFIFAIAGSNGRKATTNGAVFTFNALGLQIGEVTITCQARVSIGDQTLTELSPASDTLSVVAQQGTLAGTVHAYKPVTVSLYDAGSTLVASATANQDGTFSLQAPAGAYTAVASVQGYLDAQGAATLTSGSTTTMPTITLPAGDIDGNDVIDQFDAMTIGMNYNGSTPAAADLNNDGIINVLDLELLAANYRLSGALVWQ